MTGRVDISEFLRSRRARLKPQEVGLSAAGGRRRVPGLRRSELGTLASVSVEYYTRIEQGRAGKVSEAVLDAISRALRLDAAEEAHLHDLLGSRPAARRGYGAEQRVRRGVEQLVTSIATPAFVLGRRMACLLLADFPAMRPSDRNMARWIFLSDDARGRYLDWPGAARETVAALRFDAGRHPDDPQLKQLIGELSVSCPEFAGWWATGDMHERTFGEKRYRHPIAGDLMVAYEAVRLADDRDQLLVMYTTEPGSRSEQALNLLDAWSGNAETAHAPGSAPSLGRRLRAPTTLGPSYVT